VLGRDGREYKSDLGRASSEILKIRMDREVPLSWDATFDGQGRPDQPARSSVSRIPSQAGTMFAGRRWRSTS
jgi:hypothetical protein